MISFSGAIISPVKIFLLATKQYSARGLTSTSTLGSKILAPGMLSMVLISSAWRGLL